jgi:branched-chain amino acid transport system substrate-binding protein
MKKILAASLLCVGCGAFAQEELKIGAIVTLSGAGAAWGQAMLYATELAADDVNAKGGLDVGGKKYKVKVVAYDDKYQAGEAVTAANRLVFEDKVKYVIGPVGSAAALAVGPIMEKNKVVMLTLGFTDKALAADKPFSFRPNLTTMETSQPQIDWIVKAKGIKKVGALFPNDETGQQIALDLEKAYAKAGAKMDAKEFFERERVDMMPLLTRIMAKGVDAIELDGNAPGTAGLIVKQARELGFKGHIIRSGGPATTEIVNVAGAGATNGMLVNTPIDPANAEVKAYAERYFGKYKKRMNGFSPAFYDGTRMLFQAMGQAGSTTDTDKVRVALEGIKDFKGILGTLNWTGKEVYGSNHQISAPFYIARVQDGQEMVESTCSLTACK